jgi:hypothetical protein
LPSSLHKFGRLLLRGVIVKADAPECKGVFLRCNAINHSRRGAFATIGAGPPSNTVFVLDD